MIETYSESSMISSEADDDALDIDSDILDAASATETLLESTDSVSDGRDGDLPEKASSTTSKKDPRTPEIKSIRFLIFKTKTSNSTGKCMTHLPVKCS